MTTSETTTAEQTPRAAARGGGLCSPPRSSSSGSSSADRSARSPGGWPRSSPTTTPAFLPSDAESTRVTELQEGFQEQTTFSRRSSSGRTTTASSAETQQAASPDLEAIASLHGVIGQVSPPIPSEDGQALQAIVLLDAESR